MGQSDWERSRTRWRKRPLEWEYLTWGQELTGDAFVEVADRYAGFGPRKRILEIGPGYGRLLKALLNRSTSFASYYGLELSEETCAYLRKQFPLNNVRFAHGDVEKTSFDTEFDVVISSATFQHLYPSMEEALRHLRSVVSPGCVFCIDLPEGDWVNFEEDGVTFVHQYQRPEVVEILDRVGLEHIDFDEVDHAEGFTRLLMVARKPD